MTSSRPLGIVAIVVGGVFGVLLSPALVTLLREGLHYQCSGGAPGTEAAGWWCADGIGYLMPVLGAAVQSGVALLAALFLVVVARPELVRQGLALVVAVMVCLGVGSTWLATSDPRSVPPGESRTGYWVEAVLPAAIVLVVVIVLAVAGLRAGRTGRILTLAGAGGTVVATVLQFGLASTTMPALGILLASALVSARDESSRET